MVVREEKNQGYVQRSDYNDCPGILIEQGGWRDIWRLERHEREKDSEKLVGSVFCKSPWGLSVVGVN